MNTNKVKAAVFCGIACICACAIAVAVWLAGGHTDGGRGMAKDNGDKTVQVTMDEHLRSCLAGAFPEKFSDGSESSGLKGITALTLPVLASEHSDDCGDLSEVSSIEGIQQLTGLRNLDLGAMPQVDSGSPLAKLTNLQHLNISQTSIADIGFVSSLSDLSQLTLPSSACDISVLAGHDTLRSVSISCTTADLTPLDGSGVQLVVPAGFDRAKVEASAATGNTVTVMNDDGSLDIYRLTDGEVAVSHV